MKLESEVREISGEIDSVIELLESIQDRTIRTGVHATEGNKPAENGARLADYATWNEFGADSIPERSFMRSTFDENWTSWADLVEKALRRSDSARTFTIKLNQIALKIEGDVVNKITILDDPPNAAETVRRKGFNNPLVETGRLRQSIRSVVE